MDRSRVRVAVIDDDEIPGLNQCETKPAFALGGAEAGYRYMRIMAGQAINTNKIYRLVRVSF